MEQIFHKSSSLPFLSAINDHGLKYSGRPCVPAQVNEPGAGFAHEVVPGSSSTRGSIFLGPMESCSDAPGVYAELRRWGIGAIVNCTPHIPCVYEARTETTTAARNEKQEGAGAGAGSEYEPIEYVRVAVHDEPAADLLVYMKGAALFVENHLRRGTSVLVHCAMGRSRSASIVIAHQIAFGNCTRDAAYVKVKTVRQVAEPNEGFWQQLARFEEICEQERTCAGAGAGAGAEAGAGAGAGAGAVVVEAVPTFDEQWVKSSVVGFAFSGAALSSDIAKASAGDFPGLLENALDFVYGENARDDLLVWLRAVCDGCDAFAAKSVQPVLVPGTHDTDGTGDSSSSGSDVEPSSKKLAKRMFASEHICSLLARDSAWFEEKWSGEYSAHKVQRIMQALEVR